MTNSPVANIDPRQPRVAAGITSIVAACALALQFNGLASLASLFYGYALFMFIWAVFWKNIPHPYSLFFKFIAKRMNPPAYLEDPRAPFFAQKIGLFVTLFAFIFSFFSSTISIVFGIMLLAASSLNAYFNVCLGCILYLRLKKLGIKL